MPELLSVGEAAKTLDIPERTFRRWVASGRIASEPDPLGVRGRVLNADVVIQFREMLNGAGQRPASDQPAPANDRPMAEVRPEPEVMILRAQLAAVERERDTLAEMVDHLRAQVDRRTEGEAELRKLLAMSQHALQSALERPMLPAPLAGNLPTKPRRTRWWNPSTWRR